MGTIGPHPGHKVALIICGEYDPLDNSTLPTMNTTSTFGIPGKFGPNDSALAENTGIIGFNYMGRLAVRIHMQNGEPGLSPRMSAMLWALRVQDVP